MTRPETLQSKSATVTAIENIGSDDTPDPEPGSHLHDAVTRAVRKYLDQLDGQATSGFYDLVLSQVEAPLLREVMQHTRNNQTRASQMLGLNRGTLRKKLKQYNLLSD
ncbi:DNA-binding transcriptional regulator Fis [Haliea sp. E1-2-M8]|uniref:DNA-binding transcriptional regulator Fis n=1 Tax=Haliea sp. E1-2-M8 TaxID=3064706 RepID=UPI00271E6452|nr:DNA-binding transcriptional regulator Fis [Haliea sp. E1-2-M8]MDO8863874.1 DNA-binding transcriptional regulator Fis [Haliea sp. E1-2-M8]